MLYSAPADTIDAIAAYSGLLTDALNASGRAASNARNWRDGRRMLWPNTDVLVVQYNPFSYGRWGFAPRLILVAVVARVRQQPRVVLMVHEPYVPINSLRSAAMGSWQRLQLWTLASAADSCFGAIEAWQARLAPRAGARQMTHLPVGANFPDMREARGEVRQQYGWSADVIVLASMTTGHPSHLSDHVREAIRHAQTQHERVVMLNFGTGPPDLSDLGTRTEILTPGPLEADQLARLLSAADVFLAPYSDGVSTRRGSLMAALQHGIPVVATIGPLTDRLLANYPSALLLSPVGDTEAFARGVDLAITGHERRRQAARELYAEAFDWPVIAERLLDVLGL